LRQNRWWCWIPSHNTTSRMHLKNGRRAGNGAFARKVTAASVPEIMDGSLHK
jgi:hypothetical protein